MRVLEKEKGVIFRFRCNRCMSQFEMTAEEREENDWIYGEHKKGGKWDYSHNPLNKFRCDVCDCERYMDKKSIHKFHIMETENGDTIERLEY